jgi:DNA modification methylase
MSAQPTPEKNKLYYGDNLDVLRRYIADESVDLIYLDPPFNSRQDYNVLFAEKDGARSASQITAFKDSWEWNIEAERAYIEVVESSSRVADAMRAFRTLLGGSDMLAYLAMMAPRLVELRRVLKSTGSIYLHCDPTASHYLKLLLDSVFGAQHFKNEIIWKRSDAHSDAKQGATHLGRVHDVIFYCSKTDIPRFNTLYTPLPDSTQERWYRHVEEGTGRRYNKADVTGPGGAAKGNAHYEWKGVTRYWRYKRSKMEELEAQGRLVYSKSGMVYQKRYLDESKGVSVQDVWTDIPMLRGIHRNSERLGYPTQKPEALLERILHESSNEGDVVLDPFCGCGTTVQVAQKLNRRWIGIDITHLAIGLIKTRLDDAFTPEVRKTYQVIGEPTDVRGAEQLALENKYQFQYWALSQVGAQPTEAIKKGADRGIDGRLYFHEANSSESKQIIFSVKGGQNIGVSEVRDLIGVLQREKADIGVYISFAEPTKAMQREAAEAGFYISADGSRYPRVQLLTVKGLIDGTQHLQRPLHVRDVTFKKAPRSRPQAATNMTLALDSQESE